MLKIAQSQRPVLLVWNPSLSTYAPLPPKLTHSLLAPTLTKSCATHTHLCIFGNGSSTSLSINPFYLKTKVPLIAHPPKIQHLALRCFSKPIMQHIMPPWGRPRLARNNTKYTMESTQGCFTLKYIHAKIKGTLGTTSSCYWMVCFSSESASYIHWHLVYPYQWNAWPNIKCHSVGTELTMEALHPHVRGKRVAYAAPERVARTATGPHAA